MSKRRQYYLESEEWGSPRNVMYGWRWRMTGGGGVDVGCADPDGTELPEGVFRLREDLAWVPVGRDRLRVAEETDEYGFPRRAWWYVTAPGTYAIQRWHPSGFNLSVFEIDNSGRVRLDVPIPPGTTGWRRVASYYYDRPTGGYEDVLGGNAGGMSAGKGGDR